MGDMHELLAGSAPADENEPDPVVQAPTDQEEREPEGEPEDGPPADHPRFNQVYGRMKHLERQNQALLDESAALRRQNAEIISRLDSIGQPADEEPDFDTDPQAWRQWEIRRQGKERMESENKEKQNRLNSQIDMMRTVHDDYDEVVKAYTAEIDRDERLRNRIFSTQNPPKAAYQYCKRRMEEDAAEREGGSLNPTGTGSRATPRKPSQNLTAQEKQMAAKFGMTPEEWVQERDALEKSRRENSLV